MTTELVPKEVSALIEHINATNNALMEALTLEDAKSVIDRAETLRVWSRQIKAGIDAQNAAASVKLRAQRKSGEFLRDMPKHPPGPNPYPKDGEILPAKIEDYGISYVQSSKWQQIANIPEEEFEEYIRDGINSGEELTTAGALRIAENIIDVDDNVEYSSNLTPYTSSESNEWYTPYEYVDAVRELMGSIDLDPASNEEANRVVKATKIYTIDDDGLDQLWRGNVFVNPPYGKNVDRNGASNQRLWSERIVMAWNSKEIKQGVLLVTASTSERWFQPLWDYPICFTSHRIQFEKESGDTFQPVTGSAFVYFGNDEAAFIRVFQKFGPIVKKVSG